ncbi:YjbF family lipoprotein [Marinibacterium profundimaris]|uniref:YjbF family lipoprotein n=1 Tax=Marinibacterium profundimaris TaxID=1679460 RepID=UPI000B52163B|nr:YjbF family lipoprotein [Marinibacterium profundimaris]
MKRAAVFLAPVCVAALFACTNTTDDFAVATTALFGPGEVDPRVAALQQNDPTYLKMALLDFDTGSLIVLEARNGEYETWLTSEGSSITTRSGFLQSTRGLGQGLMAADVSEPMAMVRSGAEGQSVRFHSYLDGNDEIEIRTYVCDIENRGQDVVQLETATINTRMMAETCNSMDQEFENLYWLNPATNEIVQSSQWAGDFLGRVAMQVVPK